MKTKLIIAIGVIAMVFIGCAKDPYSDMSNEDKRIYQTNVAEGTDFKTYTTFWISDSAFVVDGSQVGQDNPQPKRQLRSYDQKAKDMLTQQLTARGYRALTQTEIADTVTPDLAINLTRINLTTVYYYWDYWNWNWYYWNWYYPGYYYPYYWPVVTYSTDYAYVVTMMDAKKILPSRENPNVLWNATMRGENDIFSDAAVEKFINVAFEQSQYISK